MQLAQCRFPGLVITNAKILIYFFIYNTRKQFYQPALRNCHGLNLPQCRLQFKKKRYCVVYYNLRHTFVPYKKHKTFLHLRRDAVSRSLIRSSTGVETTPLSCCLRSTMVAVCSSRLRQRRTAWLHTWARSQKGKGSPYSITERRVPELIPVLGSQAAGDVSHKPGGRLPLLLYV